MGTPSHAIGRARLHAPPSPRHERLFFGSMAVGMTLFALAGFAPTYYLKGYFGTPPLSPLLHVHGLSFSLWMVLLVAQTSLVAAGRTDLHRRLGVAGAALAVAMVIFGAWVAIARAKQGVLGDGNLPPLQFLTIPLFGITVFAVLVAAALWLRRRSAIHKRLMLIATAELITAAIARLPGIAELGPPGFFGVANLFVVAIVGYDLITLKRVHWATVLGGALLVASQVLRLAVSDTAAWHWFALWLTA